MHKKLQLNKHKLQKVNLQTYQVKLNQLIYLFIQFCSVIQSSI